MKILTPIVAIVLIVIGGLFFIKSQFGHQQSSVEIRQGSVLPDFILAKIDGTPVNISTIQAKVVMLNFWATWCEACMEEMPSLIKLRNQLKDSGFEVVGVNLDENPDVVVPKAMKEFQISFPIFRDPEGKVADLFDVHAIPLSVFINQKREILKVVDGGQDWNSPKVHDLISRWLSP